MDAMLEPMDEFLISAYVDGDLSAEERARVEGMLESSENARRALREYRQLSGLLRLSRETPAVDWAAMREAVLERIEDGAPARGVDDGEMTLAERAGLDDVRIDARGTSRRAFWASRGGTVILRRTALAASLLLALGLGWEMYRSSGVMTSGIAAGPGVNPVPGAVAAVEDVAALNIAVGMGRGGGDDLDVTIGPAPSIAKAFPSIKMNDRELYPRYGSVKVTPDVESAGTRNDSALPY